MRENEVKIFKNSINPAKSLNPLFLGAEGKHEKIEKTKLFSFSHHGKKIHINVKENENKNFLVKR